MKFPPIVIDKDSRGTVVAVWAATAAIFMLLQCLGCCAVVKWGVLALMLIFCAFVTAFFRVPERDTVGDDRKVCSVADGEIVIVEKAFEEEFLKRECLRVCIYMDFFDVHANFWPVSGEIIYNCYHPGRHKLAFKPKSSVLNEHATSAIRTASGDELLFKQIAGTFARRIESYSTPGLQTVAGEQCGIIKFGSRIDIYLPVDAVVRVSVGDKVRACETLIAELRG